MIFMMVLFFGTFGILYWICAKIANLINRIPYIGPWIVKIIRDCFWGSLLYPIFFLAAMIVLGILTGFTVALAPIAITALIVDFAVCFIFI